MIQQKVFLQVKKGPKFSKRPIQPPPSWLITSSITYNCYLEQGF